MNGTDVLFWRMRSIARELIDVNSAKDALLAELKTRGAPQPADQDCGPLLPPAITETFEQLKLDVAEAVAPIPARARNYPFRSGAEALLDQAMGNLLVDRIGAAPPDIGAPAAAAALRAVASAFGRARPLAGPPVYIFTEANPFRPPWAPARWGVEVSQCFRWPPEGCDWTQQLKVMVDGGAHRLVWTTDRPLKTVYQYLHDIRRSLHVPRLASDQERKELTVEAADTAFGTELSYLHNEFNFDAAKPLRNFALGTHVSFLPLHAPKYAFSDRQSADEMRYGKTLPLEYELPAQMSARFQRLKDASLHHPGGFSGGEDVVADRMTTFLDYSEKIITSLAAIESTYIAIKRSVAASGSWYERQSGNRAIGWNARANRDIGARGMSSRISMIREFALRMLDTPRQTTRLAWVRHHSHYQTLTAIEESYIDLRQTRVAGDGRVAPFLLPRRMPAAPVLAGVVARLEALFYRGAVPDPEPLLRTTAFDSFPLGWARDLFGRYLQGANYLFLPASLLFSEPYRKLAASIPAPDRGCGPTLRDDWVALMVASQMCRSGKSAPGYDYGIFLGIWRRGHADPALNRLCGLFLFRLLQPLVRMAFSQGERIADVEFCMCAAMSGGAVILSNVKNLTDFPESQPADHQTGATDKRQEAAHVLMTETIVLDFGLNDFERGRLFKQLSELSTDRILALKALATFRFLGGALDTVRNELSNHIKNWVGEEDGEPRTKKLSRRRTRARADDHHRHFANSLQDVTVDLTLLNDLVDDGIIAHVSNSRRTARRARARLEQIGETPLPGFLSLSEFLDRRFTRSAGAIEAVGDRYELLRRRVSELSGLVDTQIVKNQNDSQSSLLEKVDRLTLFGIIYYFGTVLAYVIVGLFIYKAKEAGAEAGGGAVEPLEDTIDKVKFFIFPTLMLLGVYIGHEVLALLGKELRSSIEVWAGTGRRLLSSARRGALRLLRGLAHLDG